MQHCLTLCSKMYYTLQKSICYLDMHDRPRAIQINVYRNTLSSSRENYIIFIPSAIL